jgi:hypothetical protein
MKIDKRCVPEIASAKESGRYKVCGVWLHKREGRFYTCSTDGRMLLLCPVDSEEGDYLVERRLWPLAAWKVMRKAAGRHQSEAVAAVNGTLRVTSKEGVAEYSPIEEPVPHVDDVIPKGPAIGKATFNAEQLVALQRGMGCDAITIEWLGDDLPARVLPAFGGVDGCIGVVMPWSGT